VALNLHFFSPRPGFSPCEGHQQLNHQLVHIPGDWGIGSAPWKKFTIDVRCRGVTFSWAAAPGEARRVVAVDKAALDAYSAKLQVLEPQMSGHAWQSLHRGAVGLYVRNSQAAFRNVVLEALESNP